MTFFCWVIACHFQTRIHTYSSGLWMAVNIMFRSMTKWYGYALSGFKTKLYLNGLGQCNKNCKNILIWFKATQLATDRPGSSVHALWSEVNLTDDFLTQVKTKLCFLKFLQKGNQKIWEHSWNEKSNQKLSKCLQVIAHYSSWCNQ